MDGSLPHERLALRTDGRRGGQVVRRGLEVQHGFRWIGRGTSRSRGGRGGCSG